MVRYPWLTFFYCAQIQNEGDISENLERAIRFYNEFDKVNGVAEAVLILHS